MTSPTLHWFAVITWACSLAWLSAVGPVISQETQPRSAAALFQEAYQRSQSIRTVEDCTKVLEMCEQGLQMQAPVGVLTYGRQLAAWTHNKRGELLAASSPSKEAEALADFEAAVRLDNTKAKYLHNRGVSYGGTGQLQKAREDFDAVLRLDPNYAKALFNRGEILTALGEYGQAVRDYSEVLALDSRDAAAYNARGFAYYKQRNYVAALNDYSRSISLDSNNTEAYVNRGDAYADLGRFAEAQRDYQRALQLAPESARAHLSAAWLWATCAAAPYRNGEAAVQSAEKAIAAGGETPRSLDILAAALARAGKYAQAVETQAKAISLAREAKASERELKAYEARLKRYQEQKPYADVSAGQPQPE